MVQLPVVDMKLSGPLHPPVRHWHFVRASNAAEKNIQCLIEKTVKGTSSFFPICVLDPFVKNRDLKKKNRDFFNDEIIDFKNSTCIYYFCKEYISMYEAQIRYKDFCN